MEASCPTGVQEVCGIDNKTYKNYCEMNIKGIQLKYDG